MRDADLCFGSLCENKLTQTLSHSYANYCHAAEYLGTAESEWVSESLLFSAESQKNFNLF